jgi:hypothetical protein
MALFYGRGKWRFLARAVATGEELAADARASWCDKPWCYIDPANCDVEGHATSNYGWMTSDCTSTATSAEADVVYTPQTCLVSYSYGTCGASDDYTAPSYIEAKLGLALSVALSLCTTAHPLHTRIANIFGTSISETTMRPNPRRSGTT